MDCEKREYICVFVFAASKFSCWSHGHDWLHQSIVESWQNSRDASTTTLGDDMDEELKLTLILYLGKFIPVWYDRRTNFSTVQWTFIQGIGFIINVTYYQCRWSWYCAWLSIGSIQTPPTSCLESLQESFEKHSTRLL